MRPTIVLLSPTSDHQELAARLRRVGSYSDGAIFDHLDWRECRFGVDVSGDVIGDFDEEEIAEIREELGEFNAILVEYPDMACIRDLLAEVIPGVRGILDTNHGELLGYEAVLNRFHRDPSWDWRISNDGATSGVSF
ncbi:hypothetical protein [Streptomyces sp. NPDC058657]|uniref:hypothetical protein n=1 Tax=unclassified Streptomyces TaxID=2593676 RepID=UPI003668B26D